MKASPRAAFALLVCGAMLIAAVPAKKTSKAKSPALPSAAQHWMRSLSLRDKVAQLIVMPCYGEPLNTRSAQFRNYQHWVRDLHVGGLIVLGHIQYGSVHNAEPYAMAALLNRMQKMSRIPLFAAADFERGASMRVNSTVQWPYNMAFSAAGDVAGAREEGASTARDARALGINWVFAPVADVNNNPDNPIINIRSYGEDPEQVSRYVTAYIEGAHQDKRNPVLVTAKHFPGHGDTAQDSHMDLARLDADRNRINKVELVPFRAAIGAGVDAVMTAHLAVPALEPENIPATVSSKILTGVLRDELAFHGIIVTDAMDMRGVSAMFDNSEAAVRAIDAGADVLLMPIKAEDAINGVVAAVRSGRLTQDRLNQSVARVLAAKARLGLIRGAAVNYDHIADVIGAPEDEERAQAVADHALTLVKDTRDMLSVHSRDNSCFVVLPESHSGQQGKHLLEEVTKRSPKIQTQLLEPGMSKADLDQAAQSLASCDSIFAAAYVTVSAYRGNVALAGEYPAFMNTILNGKAPVALISLGNPYLVRSFGNVAAYLTTYSTTAPSETAIAKALFGEIAIAGHLPVTIPGIAKAGDGIQVPASAAATPAPAPKEQ